MDTTKKRIYTHANNNGQYYDRHLIALGAKLTKTVTISNVTRSHYEGWYRFVIGSAVEGSRSTRCAFFEWVKTEDDARSGVLVHALWESFGDWLDKDYLATPLTIASASESFLKQLECDVAAIATEGEESPSHVKLLKRFMAVNTILITKELSALVAKNEASPDMLKELFR